MQITDINQSLQSLPPLSNQQLPAQTQPIQWTLENFNHAEWSDVLEQRLLPVYAKARVLLSRHNASPGAIDGSLSFNTIKALSAFQIMQGLKGDGQFDQATWQKLISKANEPVFIEYTLSKQDLQYPYGKPLPEDYADQAQLKGLFYTRVSEMLAEKFHMDELFLQHINPKSKFNKIGEKIIVANAKQNIPADIQHIIAHKGTRQLYLLNRQYKIIASFPASIGSEDTPSPIGTYRVLNIVSNPHYRYEPKRFDLGSNLEPVTLPPGPNNPVGDIWMGLSKPHYGIHGTPTPSLISKAASHGCIRLTNWDANSLAKQLKVGVDVQFLE